MTEPLNFFNTIFYVIFHSEWGGLGIDSYQPELFEFIPLASTFVVIFSVIYGLFYLAKAIYKLISR